MHRSVIYFLICCVLGKSYGASVVVDSVGGHHVAVRKVVPEGSQVSLQCRVPVNSQLSRMMDLIEPSPLSNPVVWLRFDMKDPSNQEVISHGDTLLIDTNPRLRLAFQEDTRTSTLIIDRAEVQDGGIFQCQVFVRDEVVPSSLEKPFSSSHFPGDNRSSVHNVWHAQPANHHFGPLLQLPAPPLYDAPGDALLSQLRLTTLPHGLDLEIAGSNSFLIQEI